MLNTSDLKLYSEANNNSGLQLMISQDFDYNPIDYNNLDQPSDHDLQFVDYQLYNTSIPNLKTEQRQEVTPANLNKNENILNVADDSLIINQKFGDSERFKRQRSKSVYPESLLNRSSDMSRKQIDLSQFAPKNIKSKQDSLYSSLLVQLYVKKLFSRFNRAKLYFEQLGPYHYSIINDQSTKQAENKLDSQAYRLSVDYMKKQTTATRIFRRLRRQMICIIPQCLNNLSLFDKCPIISPESQVKFIWDIVMTVIRIYLLFVIPIEIAFNCKLLFDQLKLPTLLSIISLIVDIFLNFNTSYFQYGSVVSNRSQIIKNYIDGRFYVDVTSTLTLLSITIFEVSQGAKFTQPSSHPVRHTEYLVLLFFFFQVNDISQVKKKFQEAFNFSIKTSLLIDLVIHKLYDKFKLVVFLFFTEHLFTCIWYLVGSLGQQSGMPNWIDNYKHSQSSLLELYIYAFYFSTVTMITVGYGDIVPQNDIERVVVIIFMIGSQIQLSYTVSSLWNIIIQFNQQQEEQMNKLRAINKYMQQKKISFNLQFKIREYLNYFWQEEGDQTEPQQKIFEQLSEDLKENLMMEANSLVLKDCSFFSNYFSQELKKNALRLIKQLTLFPETLVHNQLLDDNKEDSFIFFVEKGSIEVLLDNNLKQFNQNQRVTTITILQKGDNFGVQDFITGNPLYKNTQQQYRSIGFTKLIYLSRKQFLILLNQFPEDYEQFCQLKHEIEFKCIPKLLNLRCYSCEKKDHGVEICPILHFIPDKEFLVKKQTYGHQQTRLSNSRKIIDRNQNQRFNALKDRDFLTEVALAFQLENEVTIEQLGLSDDSFDDKIDNSESQNNSRKISIIKSKAASASFNLESIEEQDKKQFIMNLSKVRERVISVLPTIKYSSESSGTGSEIDEVHRIDDTKFLSYSKKPTHPAEVNQKGKQFTFSRRQSVRLDIIRSKIIKEQQSPIGAQKSPSLKQKKSILFQSSLLKLKSAVKKVNQFKKFEQEPQMNSSYLKRKSMNVSQQSFEITRLLQKRKAKRLNHNYVDKDSENMNLLVILKSNQLNQADQTDDLSLEFESFRVYKYFQPQNNLTQVLQEEVQQKSMEKYINSLISKYSKYLLYPFTFIKKYKLQQLNEEKNQDIMEKKKIRTKSKLNTSSISSAKFIQERSGERRKTKAFKIIQDLQK